MTDKYWMGPAPEKCDICAAPIDIRFFEAKTQLRGMWANMCFSCHALGPGLGRLGNGLGQEYKKQKDGKWLKVGG
jgi:hypothetical protein